MAEQKDKDAENERKYGRAEDEVVEASLIRSKTISLNRQKSMEPGLASWLEELQPYEEPFPKHDEHGRYGGANAY